MNNTLDTYLSLCTQVYDLSKPTPPQDAYEFYRYYAINARGPILEPMCGTGRFLLSLMEEGIEIHGFDASSHMLETLHKKAKLRNLNPKVERAFVENFQIKEKYGLIFIPSGSFGLIIDVSQAKASLKKFYDCLNDDGVLIFEAETLRAAPKPSGMWRGSVWAREDSKLIIANFLDLPVQANVMSMLCRYELVDNHHVVHTEIENFKVRLYNSEQVIAMLKEIGFKTIKMLKAFEHSKNPDDTDEVIVYECRK